MNKEKYIEVTVPQESCTSGMVLLVTHIDNKGNITGLNAKRDSDWTHYHIPVGEYKFIDFEGE